MLYTSSVFSQSQDKSALELGLHVGNFTISGDVDHSLLPGYGAGIHIRKAISNSFSLRAELFYGKTTGINLSPSTTSLENNPNLFADYGVDNPWFFSYCTRLFRMSIQGVVELTNLGKTVAMRKYNVFVFGGLGLNSNGTKLNLLDHNNEPYQDLIVRTGFNLENDFNTIAGRREIRQRLKSIFDSSYETSAPKKTGTFRLGNETNIALEANIGFGISRRISKRLNITMEHLIGFSDNNLLDGNTWRTDVDRTNDNDLIHYTSIRFGFNMGRNPIKEPVYWENPFDQMELKADSVRDDLSRIRNEINDDDDDGVINGMDNQKRSEAGSLVDAKGRRKDSDLDGLFDDVDPYPYVLADHMHVKLNNEGRDYAWYDSSLLALSNRVSELERFQSDTFNTSKYLNIIYFDSNDFTLSLEELKKLAFVASKIKEENILCIQIIGHTDKLASEIYNDELAEKRVAEVKLNLIRLFDINSEFIQTRVIGEREPAVKNTRTEQVRALNRRVEIKVCPLK